METNPPFLSKGATRDKKTRDKQLAIVNPNYPPEKMAKHMSAELGWVRVRSGREDVFATTIKQVALNRFMLCFSSTGLASCGGWIRDSPHPLFSPQRRGNVCGQRGPDLAAAGLP